MENPLKHPFFIKVTLYSFVFLVSQITVAAHGIHSGHSSGAVSFGQFGTTDTAESHARNPKPSRSYLSMELMGKAGYVSLSYEHQWAVFSHFFIQPGLGIGTALLYDFERTFNPDLTFPAHLFMGINGKHRPELGITYTASYYTVATLGSTQKGRQYTSLFFGHLGYRLQSRLGFLRIAYTPRLLPADSWVHMGGITLGYGF